MHAIAQTHYILLYITQLRHNLESDPTHPWLPLTESGVGCRTRTE